MSSLDQPEQRALSSYTEGFGRKSGNPLTSPGNALTPAPVNTVDMELGELRGTLDELHKAMEAIDSKAAPFLRPPQPESGQTRGDVPKQSRSKVAEDVCEIRRQVWGLIDYARYIHDRIDL